MKVDMVVDIGNSRMKWGWCANGTVEQSVSLPPDDDAAWDRQLTAWKAHAPRRWAITSVHFMRRDRLLEWLEWRGHQVIVVDRGSTLPLAVLVDQPEQVGMDRLMNAVAAESRRGGKPAIIVDAGTAVTVDVVDETGAFRGGAIFPGLRLMAKALHDYTALLPLVEISTTPPDVIATSTTTAIQMGVFYAVVGGINAHISLIDRTVRVISQIFLTGGDARLLRQFVYTQAEFDQVVLWPEMTLEGIRIAAEAQP